MKDRPIQILFGTQTGNSELIAEEIAETLDDLGERVEVTDMADAYPEMLEEVDRLIVCLCTWADGTFPDNAVHFWESLLEVEPDCSGMRYAIVALGDRLYDPYYQVAAYRLAERLEALGASRAVETYEIDGAVRPSHREEIREWANRFAKHSESAADLDA